jgi:hypothetical protein
MVNLPANLPERSMPETLTVVTAASRIAHWLLVVLALLLAGPILALAMGRASLAGDWRTATQRPAGLAPDPATHSEAVVQVYASRAFGWRGAFSDHTWLAAKPRNATTYARYEVIGWYGGGGRSVVSVGSSRAPDAEWYGAAPRVVRDLRGAKAEAVIAQLPKAVASYDSPTSYRVWPGPNSNTFVAHLGRAIPELGLAMPPTAVGKDYLPGGGLFAHTPSGTGWQVSLLGVLGVAVGKEEGLELNLLGLTLGVDVRHPALKLPGIGRLPE